MDFISIVGIITGLGIAYFVYRSFKNRRKKEPALETFAYTSTPQKFNDAEAEMFILINEHRGSKGLSILKSDSLSKQLADEHVQYMIDKGEASHDNFKTYRSPKLLAAGAVKINENAARGYMSAHGMFNAYIRSQGHLENIEGSGFTHVGISTSTVKDDQWNVCIFTKFPKTS